MPSSDAANSCKRVYAEWKLVLGESAVDICLLRVASPATSTTSTTTTPAGSRRDLTAGARSGSVQQELLIVCEHSLFVVSAASGQLLLQRRLEYHPAACRPYPAPGVTAGAGGGEADNLLVATHTKALLVYQGSALVWAARLEVQPVALRVAAVGGLKGMIVALDDAGERAGF